MSNELIAGTVITICVVAIAICMMAADQVDNWSKSKSSIARSAVDLEIAKKARIDAEARLVEAQYKTAMKQHDQINKERV